MINGDLALDFLLQLVEQSLDSTVNLDDFVDRAWDGQIFDYRQYSSIDKVSKFFKMAILMIAYNALTLRRGSHVHI